MTPPSAPLTSDTAGREVSVAGLLSLERLRNRSDFLQAARGKRVVTPGFILQVRSRSDATGAVRVGFTCSKKVGNAVARNRAKRRLREIARLVLPSCGRPGTDYVLVGRAGVTATRPFDTMLGDLRHALDITA
ncbi:ribonuclease P protein component [Tateyamaria sp. SN6-1]|uniref:ribonuclease P protein component n=1 Tax=Tateyamaria sp. SN6-1 TaxID=3092148 RepID=UPI0039F580C3